MTETESLVELHAGLRRIEAALDHRLEDLKEGALAAKPAGVEGLPPSPALRGEGLRDSYRETQVEGIEQSALQGSDGRCSGCLVQTPPGSDTPVSDSALCEPRAIDQAVTERHFTSARASVNPSTEQAPNRHSAIGGGAFVYTQVTGPGPWGTRGVAVAEAPAPSPAATDRASSTQAIALHDPAWGFDPGGFGRALPAVVVTPFGISVQPEMPKPLPDNRSLGALARSWTVLNPLSNA